jgi:hypothetical protein
MFDLNFCQRRSFAALFIAVAAVLCGNVLNAEQPSITAVLTSSETALGQPVQLEIKISGVTNATPPQQIDVDGLQISLTDTRRSFEMHGFSSVESSLFYGYTVMPTKTGTFKIPPQTVQAGNTVLKTPELTLHVLDAPGGGGGNTRAAPADAAAIGDKLAFAELLIPKKTAYVGEMIPAVVRIGFNSKTPPKGLEPPHIEGQGFTTQKLTNAEENLETIDGRRYIVLTYKTAISAARAGNFQIGPIETKATVLVPRRNSGLRRMPFDPFDGDDPFANPLFDPFRMRTEALPITVKSEPVALEVKTLPPAAPPGFTGAVGNFSMVAEANPKRVQIGDPITIKTTIAGRGNFDRVNAPALSDEKGWHKYPASADFKQDDEVGISGNKTFEMVVSPNEKKPSLPPLVFSYFDPLNEKYVTLQSEAVPLTVEGTAAPPPPAPPSAPTPTAPSAARPAEILHQMDERGRIVRTFAPIYAWREFWLAQIVPALIALGLAAWKIQKARRSNRAAIRAAQLQHETDELLRKLRRDQLAPQEYFADASRVVQLKTALKQNMEPAAVDAETAAQAFALDDEQRTRLSRLFATSDELRYSGKPNGEISNDRRREVLELIESLRV